MELHFKKKKRREKHLLMLCKKRNFTKVYGNRGCHPGSNTADCHSQILCEQTRKCTLGLKNSHNKHADRKKRSKYAAQACSIGSSCQVRAPEESSDKQGRVTTPMGQARDVPSGFAQPAKSAGTKLTQKSMEQF